MKKTIVVVGAGNGCGNRVAEKFGQNDFRVVLMARNSEHLKQYEQEFKEKGIEVYTRVADAARLETVTKAFDEGAELSLNSVLVEHGSRKHGTCKVEGAILKANSPSCGSGVIYDGTFSGMLTGGNGMFTDKLIDACLEERANPDIEAENRVFADDFKICDENHFMKVFGK